MALMVWGIAIARVREAGVARGNGVLRGMVHETSKRVGVDGRGHYGNRGWVSGLHDGLGNVPRALGMDFSRFATKWG